MRADSAPGRLVRRCGRPASADLADESFRHAG